MTEAWPIGRGRRAPQRPLIRPPLLPVLLRRSRLVVTRCREHGNAADSVASAKGTANRAARVAGDRDIDLVQNRVGSNRMVAPTRGSGCALDARDDALVLLMRPGVDDTEELIAAEARRRLGQEVLRVAFVEPDLVRPTLVVQRRDDGAALSVDDHRRARRIAAEQDLVLRAECHSLRPGAFVDGAVERILDLHCGRRNHDDRTGLAIISWAVYLWDVEIEFPGARAPLALLDAVGGLRCAGGAV